MPTTKNINLPEYTTENHIERIRSRVTYAWEDKRVFDSLLRLAGQELGELEEAFRALKQDRTIDTAKGRQLDLIGKIVGQPREIIDAEMLEYFSYQGVPLGQAFGDLQDASKGGIYYDMTNPLYGEVLLTDDEYRLFIKAKIFKDNSRGTPDEVVEFMKFVFKAIRLSYDSYNSTSWLVTYLSSKELLGIGFKIDYELAFIPGKPMNEILSLVSPCIPLLFRGFIQIGKVFQTLTGGTCIVIGGGIFRDHLRGVTLSDIGYCHIRDITVRDICSSGLIV